ncbi:MAG: PEP-CTERM sorting domain-containing protein [Mariniblastus sp.]
MKTLVSEVILATISGVTRLSIALAFIGLLATPAVAQVFGPGTSDSALFDTVINLPPEPNIGSGQSVGGDGQTTQLNLSGNGFINSSFDVLSGAELNVAGGRINSGLDVRSGGELNISGGLIGFSAQAFSGSHVTMTGGLVDQNFEALSGSVVLLKGGALSRRFRARAGSGVEIFGQDYRLNGNLIAGADLADVSLTGNDVLTGALEDGSSFIFSPQAGDVILDVQLTQSSLPGPADTTPIFINTPNPVRPSGLRAGQTLTLQNGGELDINFEAVDATVNIEGGFLGDHSGFSRSTVNISGGEVDAFSNAYAGTVVNLTGGKWGRFSDAHAGSTVNVIGGTLDSFFEAQAGSTINLSLGLVEANFTALAGSEVDIAGGAIGDNFNIQAGSNAELFGGEFRLNGSDFDGSTLTLGDDDVFTGTLVDGSAFIFAGNRGDDIIGLNLLRRDLPELDTTPQVIDTADHGRPSGLRQGQTLTVLQGGVLGKYFETVDGSTLNIEGGRLGADAAVVNGTVNIRSGVVDRALIGGIGSVINISGGTVGNQSEAHSGSVFNISGGDIGSDFFAEAGSLLNISGGTFEDGFETSGIATITGGIFDDDFTASDGSLVNISGGIFGDDILFEFGSEVNLFGSNFLLDGVLLDDSLQFGDTFLIDDGDLLLGIFVDGSDFSFDLTKIGGGALSVTLARSAVPEPSGISLLCLAGVAMFSRRRRETKKSVATVSQN